MASPPHRAKVFICDASHPVHGRATTGEDSEYLKKTSVRDLFIMSWGTTQSREKMSLTVKITALWGLKVPLEGMCRFSHQPGLGAHIRCFLRHADNHQVRDFHLHSYDRCKKSIICHTPLFLILD